MIKILNYSSNLYSYSYIDILMLANNAGYYIIPSSGSSGGNPYLWKYLFSTSLSAQCRLMNSLYYYNFGQWILTNDKVFIAGSYNDPYYFCYYKITFANTALDWARKFTWTSGWGTYYSETIVDSTNTYIYIFNYIQTPTTRTYFITLTIADGSSVGSRYMSISSLGIIYGLAQSGNYLMATWEYGVVVVDLTSFTFTIKTFSEKLYDVVADPYNNM